MSLLRFVIFYLASSLLAGALALLNMFPWHPETPLGWLVLFGTALPIAAAGEWLGDLIFENRFSAQIGRNKAPGSISWLRVAYGLVAVLLVMAIAVGLVVAVVAMAR